MPFIAILLNPICQSWPKMGQNSQNHNFMFKIDIFWFQWTHNGFLLVGGGGGKIALFGVKTAFLGTKIADFEAVLAF